MELKFIGQGLDHNENRTTGNLIIDSLEIPGYSSFNAFVAFVSTGGLRNIIEKLIDFKARGGKVCLYVGVDLNATSKEALEQLLNHNIETHVFYSPNNIIYHPKIYAFEGREINKVILGSSNLTESGLFQNVEASVCIDFDNNDEQGKEFLSDLYDHFNLLINQQHPSCKLLTVDVLNILVESNVVLPEAINRAKTNQINKEFGQKESKVNTRLLEIFGKLKSKRPPKGFRRTVYKKEFVLDNLDTEINIIDQNIDLNAGSMWIQTGLMTGGSRNILDLSKNGQRDGVNKFGSVSYFGLDPQNMNSTKDIDVIFGGKIYKSNHIFYADGNSNWRIRLNGETVEDEKITSFSKPNLGQNGGFQNKILLFTKVDDKSFNLEVLELEELPRLMEHSADWAMGGRGGNGRAYGIISE